MKASAKHYKIIVVSLFAIVPIVLCAQIPYIIGKPSDSQAANNANLSGNYVSSASDVPAHSNVILLGNIFSASDHHPLYELQQRGCKIIRLEGKNTDDYIARIKVYNDYISSGKDVFIDNSDGMGTINQSVLLPILKSIKIKQSSRQNTDANFAPKSLFNTPAPEEDEYISHELAALDTDNRIALNIDFKPYSSEIPATDLPILKKLADMLRTDKEMKILVEGHTAQDNSVNKGYHLNLSINRAKAVKTWLVNSGVDSARIRTIGYGTSRPIADNKTDEGRAQNRRIEIVKD